MRTLILIFSTALLLSSCSTNDDSFNPTLPPVTQIGANTFGCFVDGQLLVPRDGTGSTLGADPGMIYYGSPSGFSYNELAIRDFKSGTGGLLDLHIIDLLENGTGTYNIQNSNCQDGIDANISTNIRVRLFDQDTQAFKWYCSIENSGILTISRYDFENRILSGTFNCIVQNRDNPQDIVEITDGRFDIKWDTLPFTQFP